MILMAVAAAAAWVPKAEARSNFYVDRGCSSCHGTTQVTCNGCHRHGPTNLSATTNKTTYAPGEALTVTFNGGQQSGWIRAILYQNNQEVARSTGPTGMGGGSGFPVTFSRTGTNNSGANLTAPTAAGTYTFQAAWFGNSNNQGATHGEVRVTSNSFTVTAPVPAGALSVSPGGGLSSSGTAGGPFSPTSQTYTLSNTGGQSINWTASKTQSWTTLSSTGGSLAAGASATVSVSLNNGANSLAAGSYSDTVTFTNTTNGTGNATRPVSLTVNAIPAPTISTNSPLPAGTVGTAYSQSFSATGGTTPYSWSVASGTLPAGLSMSAGGVLSGTPSAASTSNFTVRVTGNNGASSTKAFSLTVNAAAVTLSSISISGPSSVNEGGGATYTATASWSDGSTSAVTPTWSEDSAFAAIDASGVLTASQVTGNQTVTVSASYTAGGVTRTASKSVTIVDVAATLSDLSVSGPSSVNEGGSATYTATASWSDGSTSAVTPTWSEDSAFAAIDASGVLTASQVTGNQTLTVSASYTAGGVTKTATRTVTITDVPADPTDTVPPTVTTTTPPDLAVDVYVNTAIEATFSEQIDPSTLNADRFRMFDPMGARVPGSVTYDQSSMTASFSPADPLANGVLYTAEVEDDVKDLAGNEMPSTYRWTFTTQAAAPDSDGDGVGDDDDEFPNNCRNATPRTPRGNGKIRIELIGSPNGCLKKVKTAAETGPSVKQEGLPAGYKFPDGLVYYEVDGIPPGSTETVVLTYPQSHPAGSKVFKVDESGFHEFSGGAISENKVTLTVTDGGSGDLDGKRDGVIIDPVGVAVPAGSGGGSIEFSTDAAGGGCSVAGAGGGWKETAGSYGLLVLAWLGLAFRRRKARSGR